MLSSNQQLQGASTTLSSSGTSASRSLLLVDDEATLRTALRRFFMRRGWKVTEAEDGEHARGMILDGGVNREHFDVVLTDMRMPRLSGIELHVLVEQADAALARRFIFSSGDTGDDQAIAFIERSGCPVIPKPFELAALLALVERVADASSTPDR